MIERNVAYLTGKSNRLSLADLSGCSHIISFGYRHILPPEIVREYAGRAFNLHISMLPWNRGASPNLWAWYDGTPHGVTLHLIDEGVDTGKWIAQREVIPHEIDTLATSYRNLTRAGLELIHEWLPRLVRSEFEAHDYSGTGTYHTKQESDALYQSLPLGWETPCAWFREVKRGAA